LLLGGKKLVKFLRQFLFAAHQLHQSRNVVRHKELILPRVALGKAERHLIWCEWLDKTAVSLRAEKAGLGVEEVFVIACATPVVFNVRRDAFQMRYVCARY